MAGSNSTTDLGEVGSSKGRRSNGKSREEKLAEKVAEEIGNHYFNVSLFANILANNYPHYTQIRIMEIIKHLIRHQNEVFLREWEAGETNEALLLANTLVDLINAIDNK